MICRKSTGEVKSGLLIEILLKGDRLDNMLFSGNFLICSSLVMLGGDEDSEHVLVTWHRLPWK